MEIASRMRQRHADDENGSWFEGSASSMEVFLQQLINGLTLGSIYGLIAIGYTMVFGIIGMVNFAHGDIFMLSAFIALIFFMLITAVVGTGVAMFVSWFGYSRFAFRHAAPLPPIGEGRAEG